MATAPYATHLLQTAFAQPTHAKEKMAASAITRYADQLAPENSSIPTPPEADVTVTRKEVDAEMSLMVGQQSVDRCFLGSSNSDSSGRELERNNSAVMNGSDAGELVTSRMTKRLILSYASVFIGFAAMLGVLLLRDITSSRTTQKYDRHRLDHAFGNKLQRDDTDSSLGLLQESLEEASSSGHQMERRSLRTLFNLNTCQKMPRVSHRPHEPIPPSYFATYPGSGSRITRKLIKMLTGLRVQAEFDQTPKSDAVAIQTKYPHKSGALVGWDSGIYRTIILIRSPLHALPSLFDELYASKKHLPVKFHPKEPVSAAEDDAASVAEWISWRDRMFETQIASYSEFIRYWMMRYGHNERFILTYEDLMNEETGPDEAWKLANFLSSKMGVPTVDLGDAPCVWNLILNGFSGMNMEDDIAEEGIAARRRLDSYIIPHPLSIDAAPSSRPFTIEQLKVMAATMLQISEDLYTHSQHLHRILVRYRSEILDVLKGELAANEGKDVNNGISKGIPWKQKFHIFQVSPPGTESPVIANWLYGLFEPEAWYAKLITSPGLTVYQNDKEVPITTTTVTQTNEMNLIGLYKIFKPGFDEVLFVLSKSGTDADQQINEEVCEYDNVLCIGYEEQVYDSSKEMQKMVHHLTDKFHQRFAKFFSSLENPVSLQEESAVARLKGMNSVMKVMENKPFEVVDPKFGVHGGLVKGDIMDQSKGIASDPELPPRRLFYCGSTGSGANRNYSILGIFLVNAFFPEIIGSVPTADENEGRESAIPLTQSTIKDATPNDFLVYHMHQYCEVDVLLFPGQQLHINHPTHGFSAYGKYTPPSNNIFVIGAHEDGENSVQLPYAMMKWWVLVKSLGSHTEIDRPTMEKLFVPKARPKNTGKHFLLYVNSHYIAYREMAAYMLSRLGPMHALGNCQGNLDVVPMVVDASRPSRCQPYTDDMRPQSVIVPVDSNRQNQYFNTVMFQDFRFMLLFEDAKIPGYITERIVDGFMAGTVPIYYGSTQIFDIFNPKAFVYYDINNPQEALNRIKFLEENPDAYQQMLNEPILADGERTIEKYFSFEDSIGNGMLKKRVRKKLGFPV